MAPSSRFVQRDGQTVPERKSNDGVGRVYGGELLLRQSLSKWFFGWISYTLMRSERKDCASCVWRLFDFDQTHVLIIAAHAYLRVHRGLQSPLRQSPPIPRILSGAAPKRGHFHVAVTEDISLTTDTARPH